ncbi:unnamed protein product [Closterium sp. NIES-54]
MVQARKASTQIAELQTATGIASTSQDILRAASDFFADIFKRDQCQVEEDWCPAQGRKLRFWEAEELAADSTEEEVKKAFSAMAANKSLGKDGLPKELSEAHWDLLGKGFMALAKDFTSLAVLLTEAKEVVTILLHNKGDKDQLNNYRPITLLNFTYKVLARVVTNTMKKNMTWVISPEQYGFLPGRQLSDAVGLVADNIDTTRNDYEDWFLLVVDFKKTFDSVSRGYLFRTLRAMGFPDRLVCWVEGLHAETQTWVLVNGWIGGWHGGGLRADLPMGIKMFFAHEKLLKHWEGKSPRWKAAIENFMEMPLGYLLEASTREAVENERIVLTKRILLKGTTPIGGQKDAKPQWEKSLGDLLALDCNGTPALKASAMLERELGGKAHAKLAVRACTLEMERIAAQRAYSGHTGGKFGWVSEGLPLCGAQPHRLPHL